MTTKPATCRHLPPSVRGHGEKLTRKQEAAIAALVSCSTIGEAARTAGVGERTLWRWLQLPDFQTRYRAARRQVVETAIGRLQQATGAAVDTLQKLLKRSPPSVRLGAAKAILDQSVRAIELLDLAARVEVLERQHARNGGTRDDTAA